MAYVPPHKRLSKTQEGTLPAPEQLVPRIQKDLNIRSSNSRSYRRRNEHTSLGKKILYGGHAISRCMTVPVTDEGQIPTSVHLHPVSLESVERKSGEKPFTLVNEFLEQDDSKCRLKNPWLLVAENVHADLISTFQNVRNEMASGSSEEIKPVIVVRFGKLLFRRSPGFSLDSVMEHPVSEAILREWRRTFYTNIPISFMEYIKKEVVTKIGIGFQEEKEQYHVKLADAMRPDSTLSCKCRVQKGGKELDLYKIELNAVRQMVADISCHDCNVDLRLMLCTKRMIKALTDEEEQSIRDIISSAILDQKLKGGLRWPLGKANSGSRYSVVGVWHTNTEFYSNSSMKLRLREADRYDFLTSAGEVSREITLKLTGITRIILEQETADISTLLEDKLKMIWDNFLSWDQSLLPYES